MTPPLRIAIQDLVVDERTKRTASADTEVWSLNLDQIESDSGRILSRVMMPTKALGPSTYPFEAGTVLYSKLRPYLNKVVVADTDGYATTELVPLKCDASRVLPSYLAYFLRSPEFLNFANTVVAGAKMPRMVMGEFWQYKVPLPPLPEQRRIAGILDKADALRAKRGEALAQLDHLARSIFVEMFGDPTRPESTGACPTSKVQLGNFVKIQTGKLDANAAVEGGAYPFFTCAVKSLEIDIAAFDCKAVLVAGNGDLNVKYYEGKFNAYQRTYVIQSTDEHRLLPKFLYQFLDLYVAELRKQAIGGVIKYIKLPYLTDAPLNIPAIEFQKEFVARFDAIAAERKKLAEALALSERLFLSVQLRAFRGEL